MYRVPQASLTVLAYAVGSNEGLGVTGVNELLCKAKIDAQKEKDHCES